jgi:CBS domain-containing protein
MTAPTDGPRAAPVRADAPVRDLMERLGADRASVPVEENGKLLGEVTRASILTRLVTPQEGGER